MKKKLLRKDEEYQKILKYFKKILGGKGIKLFENEDLVNFMV